MNAKKMRLFNILCLILSVIMSACGNKTVILPKTESIPAHTTAATPSISEAAIQYEQLAEQELIALILNNVAKSKRAAEEASTPVERALSDNILTDHEMSELLSHLSSFQSEAVVVDELIHVYVERYSDIAVDTMDALILINEDLNHTIANSNEAIALLEQDSQMTMIEMDQLSKTVASIKEQTVNIHGEISNWSVEVQVQIDEREKFYANIPPDLSKVAYNRIDAFIQAHDFLDAFTMALDDEKLSLAELAKIGQLSANAEASLSNTGDPQLINMARQIDDLAHHAFRGEWAQASSGLIELKYSLPARPDS